MDAGEKAPAPFRRKLALLALWPKSKVALKLASCVASVVFQDSSPLSSIAL